MATVELMWSLRQMELGAGQLQLCIFSIKRTNVSTMRTGTIPVLFMTYCLTLSIHSINTFLKNKIFHHVELM